MPMLHSCAFRDCATLTLSTYCIEHEMLMRALRESERPHQHEAPVATAAAATAAAPDAADPHEPAPL